MTSYAAISVTFPDVVIKKQLKGEKIFFPVSQMKVQSMRKSKEQELEAAGHIVSTVSPREQRTLASTALLLFTETTQEPWEWFYPREMDLLPLITPSRRCPTGMPSAHLPGRSRFCQAVDEH